MPLAKSKKVRRKAAKRQRKIDEKNRLSGKIIEPKIPLAKQSIDLPSNKSGTAEGALAADRARNELRSVMRKDRRSGIKEKNFLKSM
jgi:large subunit ribosomal protein L54